MLATKRAIDRAKTEAVRIGTTLTDAQALFVAKRARNAGQIASFVRQLVASGGGPFVGPITSPDQIAGLTVWLDPNDQSTVVLSGGAGSDLVSITDKQSGLVFDVNAGANAPVDRQHLTGDGRSVKAILFDDANTEGLAAESTLLANAPMTMVVVCVPDASVTQTLLSAVDQSAVNEFFRLDIGANNVRFATFSGGGGVASANETVLLDEASVCFGQTSSAASRLANLDGQPDSTVETTSLTPTGVDRISLGYNSRASVVDFFSGKILLALVYNRVLTQLEREALLDFCHSQKIHDPNLANTFTPDKLPDLQLWLDADDGATITGAAPVTAWLDKSPNARSFTVQAGTNGPDLNAGGVTLASGATRDSLTFDSANSEGLFFAAGVLTVHPVDMWIVLGRTIDGVLPLSINRSAAGLLLDGWSLIYQSGGIARVYTGDAASFNLSSGGVAPTAGEVFLMGGHAASPIDRRASLDGTIGAANVVSRVPAGVDVTTIGYTLSAGVPSFFHLGEIMEVVVYGGTGAAPLTTRERKQVETYLHRKWRSGTTGGVPTGIPASGLVADIEIGELATTLATDEGTTWRNAGLKSGVLSVDQATSIQRPVLDVASINGLDAAAFDDANAEFIEASAQLVEQSGFTVAMVADCDDAAADHVPFAVSDASATIDHHDVRFAGTITGDPVRLVSVGSGGTGIADSPAGFTPSQAHVIVATEEAAALRRIALDGNVGVDDVTAPAVTHANLDTASLGRLLLSTGGIGHHSGRIARLLVWKRVLTALEIGTVEAALATVYGITVPATLDPSTILGPNLAGWYDASDAASVVLNGLDVSQWSDKSGNAHHAVQATPANQPLYDLGAVNGLNAIRFTDTNLDILQSPTTPIAAVAGTHTWAVIRGFDTTALQFVVFYSDRAGGGSGDFSGLLLSGATGGDPVGYQTLDSLVAIQTSLSSTGYSSGVTHVIHGFSNANNDHNVTLDDAGLGTDVTNVPTVTNVRMAIGAVEDPQALFFDGYICEIVIADGSPTAAQTQAISDYLAAKWQ